jgi:deoxyribodipyrimidine photolyase-related protein
MMLRVRMLFADQLGPHFTNDLAEDEQVLLVESRGAFGRRRVHRQKAHLLLSALRHRADELGDRAVHVKAASFGDALRKADIDPRTISVVNPTSRAARRWVVTQGMTVLPARGFTMSEDEFQSWLGGKTPRLENFYRHQRRRLDVLVDLDGQPEGGRWNFDADNRQPPPKGTPTLGLPAPWAPTEDELDRSVRADLDVWRDEGITMVGVDAPRTFAATRREALLALRDFVAHRLQDFGPYEDAIMHSDWVMAHSLLSVPLNLGLLDPLEVVEAALSAYRAGDVPLQSAEAMTRQVIGWREWAWQLYWALGEAYGDSNALDARALLPAWFSELDADAVEARCLRSALTEVRDRGWSHHIVRLMVLGNWALQRGYEPRAVVEWFRDSFLDGYDWVMVTNVIGMALYADGGRMATKPYAAGGAYLNRMSDHCQSCPYSPSIRLGAKACPFTAGYWEFLDRNSDVLKSNHRLAQPYAGLARLSDRAQLITEAIGRGDGPP